MDILRVGIRYMVEEELYQLKVNNLSDRAQRLLETFKIALKERIQVEVESIQKFNR